jgi:hypothetical protein
MLPPGLSGCFQTLRSHLRLPARALVIARNALAADGVSLAVMAMLTRLPCVEPGEPLLNGLSLGNSLHRLALFLYLSLVILQQAKKINRIWIIITKLVYRERQEPPGVAARVSFED